MRPFFFSYKAIRITWFMAFGIIIAGISYVISGILAKEYEEEKDTIEDIFMILLIIGFIGARLGYALVNLQSYKDNILSLFKISHYNLSLLGGIIFGFLALLLLSKRYKIDFNKLFKIFIVPFYFSMAVGIWVLKFDWLLLSSTHLKNNPISILLASLIFLIGMVAELILSKKSKNKYISFIILAVVMFLYYLL
ncbi:prolipoprotein diacylglyceryl transferase family protein [Schnuerera sp.]|uniref:prolipoprotein diacylglyceryl transferase family protein n=1 Tax=Schnuerera sp. TaxID=2794844 RepID=UPI002D183CE6|nr:prolipoprotein diacylglyceryl transferase family protein [Schnuerera sp.]HSH34667.1 prolipoprotein diacylglyceryl transferase family protein [Schnuerera sp.]